MSTRKPSSGQSPEGIGPYDVVLRPASEWASGEPGIYSGVPDKDYFAGPEIHVSFLKSVDHTPATGLADLLKADDEEIEAFRTGRALHYRMSDPAGFADRYVVAQQCAAITKDGKGDRCTSTGSTRIDGRWYCGTHVKKIEGQPDVVEYVKEEELRWFNEWVVRMQDPNATAIRNVLDLPGEHEVAFRWEDGPTGFMCVGKFDFFAPGVGDPWTAVAADYKTCQDASYEEVQRAINKRKYYRQQAFYEDGANANGFSLRDFPFIFLEKPSRRHYPALVNAFRIERLAVEVGRQENRRLLEIAAGCKLTGYWPGFDLSEAHVVGLPAWRGVDQQMAGDALKALAEHEMEDFDDDDELPA